MTTALFWTKDGPGEREVPDGYPPTVRIRTFSPVVSRRGDRWTDVSERTFHRQLFAARVEGADFAGWAEYPGARVVAVPDKTSPTAPPVLTLIMIVYTEWAPKR